MSELSEFQAGQSIELSDGRPATIRFVGNTHFAAGDWVGVELGDASGKNDGAVQGQRYFECPPNRGMFVRPAAVTVVEATPPQPARKSSSRANGTVPKPRPSSITAGAHKRQSLADPKANKRQSINAPSPTPASRVSRLASPSKSPTKQLSSTATSVAASRTGTPSGPGPRKSMVPPSRTSRPSIGTSSIASANKAPRPSLAGRLNGTTKPPSQASSISRSPTKRDALQPGLSSRLASARQQDADEPEGVMQQEPPITSPPPQDFEGDHLNGLASPISEISTINRPEKSITSRGRSPPTSFQRPPSHSTGSNRELEDLKAKMRVMEKKRAEDKERLKLVEKLQIERDRFEGIIQKLQTKYQPQQQEIQELKKQLKEGQESLTDLEGKLAEHDTLLEVATLDREMAEETAESFKLELDALRQKHVEVELEVSVLREENDELGKEISPEDKTSQGWLQLERSNERLREALMRLRDVTQEREADLKDQVAELEADAQDLTKTKEEYLLVKERLDQSNTTAEELRLQLEAALGAEDMIEELTEKNAALSEKMDDLRLTIEELESLKELNDELELNHVENEKQLQDEIDYHEALLTDEAKKAAVQDGTIQDLEYTVSRFRELVTNMQNDLADMRASQQITESEASELNNRSRAMMDLNMKLQTSASKTQIKAIDLELGKLQAQESLEHLSIVQLFLPDTFNSEHDSVQALLRFRRLGFKAHLMHNIVRDRLTASSVPVADEDIPAVCGLLDKLVWVWSTCDRFINHIQTCGVESFRTLGAAAYELDPMERAFNSWIDNLKRDELKFEQCAAELHRSIALLDHLAEVHVSNDLGHYPDQVLAHAAMMQSRLETVAMSLGILKSRIENNAKAPEGEDGAEENDYFEMFEKLDTLTSQSRSAKVVVGKAIRQLEDLKSRSLTLDPSTLNVVEHTQETTEDYASSVRNFGASVLYSLADEMQKGDSAFARISTALSSGSVTLSTLTNKVQATTAQLQTFYNLTNSLPQSVEFPSPPPPPPWKVLSQTMRDEKTDLAAREREFSRLKDELSERKNTLAIKDKILEEISVKNEVLEKRVGEAGGRRERVRELEAAADSFKAKEKDYTAKLSRLRGELESLERDREQWKQSAQPQPTDATQNQSVKEAPASASAHLHIESLKGEIATLESTIRYLRTAYQSSFSSSSSTYLSSPLIPEPSAKSHMASEAKDVIREMLHLISQPSAQPVKLQRRAKEDRLRWRPAKDTSTWQSRRQREDWEEWREWRDVVAKRVLSEKKEESRKLEVRNKDSNQRPEMVMPSKVEGGEVKIVGIDEARPEAVDAS